MADKETLEKSRLRERTGGYHKYIDYGTNLTAQDPSSVGFMSEADRFHTDTAGEEKLARDARVERRHDQYIQKRAVNAEREDERWARIEREKAIEEAKWQEIRDKGEKARRNHNSVPYNPLTLAYNQSEEGNRLRHADDLIRWRAAQRAKNLQDKALGSEYNPITGAVAPRMNAPSKPTM